jgi:hypothetical protein
MTPSVRRTGDGAPRGTFEAFFFPAGCILAVLVLWSCGPSPQNPDPAQPPSDPAAGTGELSPPEPQPLTLYMVPINPNDLSMPAIQENKKAVEQNPRDVKALINLAHANFMIQRFDQAREYYERALKVEPSHIEARLSLSDCYALTRKYDEAVQQLDIILNKEKDRPEALYNKGLILLTARGNRSGAQKAWTRLIKAHPDHSLSRQVKPELERL